MKKVIVVLALALPVSITFAQKEEESSSPKEKKEHSLNQEWQEAIKNAEEALRNIDIPEIDIDQIMADVRAAMPTKEQMESYKDEVADAVRELEKVDLSELEEAMRELRYELKDIFGDWDKDRHEDGPKKNE